MRIGLADYGTLTLDFNTFVAWSNRLNSLSWRQFYAAWSDYLPGYLYFLWGLGKINTLTSLSQELIFKLPAILADLVTGFFIYRVVKNYRPKMALLALVAYVFNPAVLANSTLWGQVDSLTALFSFLTLYFLKTSLFSAIFLAVGTAIKPQAAIMALVVLAVMVKNKWPLRKSLVYIFTGAFVFFLIFLPFAPSPASLPSFVWQRVVAITGQYPYTSINAFNFWGLVGLWQKDTSLFQTLGAIAVLTTSFLAFTKLKKRSGWEYQLAVIVFLAFFLFLTRIHERHLLPAFAPLLVSASLQPLVGLAYIGLSLTYLLNLFYAHLWISRDFFTLLSPFEVKIISLVNLSLFVLIWKVILNDKLKKF